MALPKVNRLKSKKDFELAFKKGNAVKGNFLFIKVRDNGRPFFRLGLVIPARIIPGAVARNRLKRVITSVVLDSLNRWHKGHDVVAVLSKKGDEDSIKTEILGLLAKNNR